MQLLDTDTCIYIIRRRSATVLQRLSEAEAGGIAVSVVTAFELEIGALRAAGRHYERAVRIFLDEVRVLALDDAARAHYGRLRVDLERRGERIGAHDMLIAAHTLALGATLVTNNEREFRRVKGLTVENWTR